MRYIILLSHGHLASGMKSTVELIAGAQENLVAYDAYVDGNGDVKQFFEAFLENHPTDELVVVTDVLGGSVNNDMLGFEQPNIYLISGMSVALVLNLVLRTETEIHESIRESLEEGLRSVMFFEKTKTFEEEEF